jgi:hypothetical protein
MLDERAENKASEWRLEACKHVVRIAFYEGKLGLGPEVDLTLCHGTCATIPSSVTDAVNS